MIFGLKKKKEDVFEDLETDDLLIIFDNDNKTSKIERVSYIKDGTIYVTGRHAIPEADTVLTNGDEGRVFFYKAPEQSIRETRRLAQLEKSMVLNQITAYKPPEQPNQMDMTKVLLFGLVFVAFVVMGLGSCGASSF